MDALEIEAMTVPSGEERRGKIPVLSLADGSAVPLPLRVIHGARPGRRLYLGAAIHGDEAAGIAILARALRAVDPAKLSGTIVCVPVQHPLALQADHRLPLAQFLKSPLDQVPSDTWTCFPGDPEGNVAQIVAARLWRLITACDVPWLMSTRRHAAVATCRSRSFPGRASPPPRPRAHWANRWEPAG
jgi:uncharacterized protein